ncbi:MAG: MarR family transcriptional regulator [Thermoleophilia bacterium]|nr:MarR family transcriptional regulator [Thermoleophilia bacterium]
MGDDRVDLILEQWARERPDLDHSPLAIVGRLARATRQIEDALRVNQRRFGLTPDEFDVLATLRREGVPFEMNPCDLGESMLISSGTVTHRLDKLEKRGLVARRPDPGDRRSVLVSLTPEGRELQDTAMASHVELEARLLGGLSDRQRSDLARLLKRLSATAVAD